MDSNYRMLFFKRPEANFLFFLNPTKEATQLSQLLLLKHGVRWERDRTDLQFEMPSVTHARAHMTLHLLSSTKNDGICMNNFV